MKVLFLDFDGVLNSIEFDRRQANHYQAKAWSERDEFDPVAVKRLAKILDAVPDVKVVISSSWRIKIDHYTPLNHLKWLLQDLGPLTDRIIDRTPDLSWIERERPEGLGWRFVERGHEIQRWIDKNPPVENFVILDDDQDMVHLKHKLVRTSYRHGLTDEDVGEVIARFREGR